VGWFAQRIAGGSRGVVATGENRGGFGGSSARCYETETVMLG
jgi:hypothetical protein